MKKISYLLAMTAIAPMWIACSNGNSSSESSAQTDTVLAATVAADSVAEQAPIVQQQQLTSDMRFFQVQGPVKSIQETEKWSSNSQSHFRSMEFDKEGNLKHSNIKIKRNKKGQIYWTKYTRGKGKEWEIYYKKCNYKLNSEGVALSATVYVQHPYSEGSDWREKYTLTEQGWINTCKYSFYTSDGSYNGTITDTYSYADIDQQGNWLSVTIKPDKGKSKGVITRKITYWE